MMISTPLIARASSSSVLHPRPFPCGYLLNDRSSIQTLISCLQLRYSDNYSARERERENKRYNDFKPGDPLRDVPETVIYLVTSLCTHLQQYRTTRLCICISMRLVESL